MFAIGLDEPLSPPLVRHHFVWLGFGDYSYGYLEGHPICRLVGRLTCLLLPLAPVWRTSYAVTACEDWEARRDLRRLENAGWTVACADGRVHGSRVVEDPERCLPCGSRLRHPARYELTVGDAEGADAPRLTFGFTHTDHSLGVELVLRTDSSLVPMELVGTDPVHQVHRGADAPLAWSHPALRSE